MVLLNSCLFVKTVMAPRLWQLKWVPFPNLFFFLLKSVKTTYAYNLVNVNPFRIRVAGLNSWSRQYTFIAHSPRKGLKTWSPGGYLTGSLIIQLPGKTCPTLFTAGTRLFSNSLSTVWRQMETVSSTKNLCCRACTLGQGITCSLPLPSERT